MPGPDDSVDERAVRAVVRDFALPFPQVRDRDLSLTTRFGVKGTPTVIVLGPGRRTVYRGHGPPPSWDGVAGGPRP